MAAARWVSLGLLGLVAVAGAGIALQRYEAEVLRREIELLKEERTSLGRLQMANDRLRAAQTPAEEVARLRADRDAVLRLRAELEAMKRAAAAEKR
ncbi:MAG: hypothetical protein V4773_20520 [Verrucomicrobiota bacterium]